MAEPNNPCPVCGGDGDNDGEFCLSCLGTGFRTGTGMRIFFKALYDHVTTKSDALDTKLDTIETHLDVIENKIDALE